MWNDEKHEMYMFYLYFSNKYIFFTAHIFVFARDTVLLKVHEKMKLKNTSIWVPTFLKGLWKVHGKCILWQKPEWLDSIPSFEFPSPWTFLRLSSAVRTCLTQIPLLSCSFTGALYSPCGGPEKHERQCRGLQVHYPLLGGGIHHCRLMGERHCLTCLR